MVEKITLQNGVRIVHERIPHVRSVSFGLWIGVGARYETAETNGASHFVEHLLFKGTKTRTAMDIAEETDLLGGQINAFTTKECTCYYGRTLDTNLRRMVDLLADMFFHATCSDKDIDAERSVISEEIDMYEDSPEDLVSEELLERVFPGSSLSLPILGTRESLGGLTRDALLAYKDAHYIPARLVVALSGNFTEDDLRYIREVFEPMTQKPARTPEPAVYVPAFTRKKKEIEQNHLCLLLPGLSNLSGDRYAAQLFSSILGGGMSSRLFQIVREEHGLCYSIYSFGASYRDVGAFGVYTALNQETEQKALALILGILRDLQDGGVTDAELHRAREQVKNSVLMSLESTSSRMHSLGRHELYRGHIPTPEEIIQNYDAVTRDDVLDIARRIIDLEQLSFSAVGQVQDEAQYRAWLR